MSIEVITAAPDKLLTKLATVKAAMGITASTYDTLLGDLIAAASDFAVRYCGREFAKQTVKESIAGKGLPDAMISLTPIVEIEKIELDDAEMDGWTILDREAGFIQRRGSFTSTNLPNPTITPHPSNYYEKRWHVTYTGGYVLPGWTGDGVVRNLPYDLERAIIAMIKSQFAKDSAGIVDGTMKSYKIGDTTIQWETSPQALGPDNVGALIPGAALAVLNYYKRVF